MIERSLVFSAPMVRGILSGTKTQLRCLYRRAHGAVGEFMWVRETWQAWRQTNVEYDEWEVENDRDLWAHAKIEYRATSNSRGPWRSAVSMPRSVSRLTLKITEVRVQLLQDISEEDARAEGADPRVSSRKAYPSKHAADIEHRSYREGFSMLWDQANGKRMPWASNPWVWAISFTRMP